MHTPFPLSIIPHLSLSSITTSFVFILFGPSKHQQNNYAQVGNLFFIRVLRLLRLLKLLRYLKGPLIVIQRAFYNSKELMSILAFCFFIILTFFGFIIYDLEQGVHLLGEYKSDQEQSAIALCQTLYFVLRHLLLWLLISLLLLLLLLSLLLLALFIIIIVVSCCYCCCCLVSRSLTRIYLFTFLLAGQFEVSNFTASEGYPNGAFVRTSHDFISADISPFDNVWTGMYWTVVTLTTVGFGKIQCAQATTTL